MKILYLINFAGKAGTEKYVENLVRIFSGDGHECHFAYNIPGKLSKTMSEMKIPSLQLDMGRLSLLSCAKNLASYCTENGIEVIHTQYPRENMAAILSKRRNRNVKVVYTNHLTLRTGLRWRLINRCFTPKNHRIIAVCREGRDIMIANGVSANKITVIYNGVDPQPSPVRDKSVLEEFQIPPDTFVMSILARYAPEKGLMFLLDSLYRLKETTDKPFVCIICGDGELFGQVADRIRELKLETQVITAGYRTDTQRILQASDLYLNSSERNEAMSFSVLEAMNAGLPLVVTDVGGNRDLAETDILCGEVVRFGDTGAFANAVYKFMTDGEYRSRMSRAATGKVAKTFDLSRLSRDVLETYK